MTDTTHQEGPAREDVRDQALTIDCPDGRQLAARLFQPAQGAATVAIALHGATGVPRDYYARFAAWLAAHRRAAVLIYDYRDCGHSAVGPVRQARASMGDWAVIDQAAALDCLIARYPDLPLEVIGHSLGGMGLLFHAQAGRVRQMTTVCTGPAHWARHPPHFIGKAMSFWFVLGPIATALLGYMPGRLLGQGADLPAAAFWQWRRWCTRRAFHRAEWGRGLPQPDLSRMKGRVRLLAVADDEMIPPAVVRDYAAFFPAAKVEHEVIDPKAAGLRTIGHLRVFSERCRDVWPTLAVGGQG